VLLTRNTPITDDRTPLARHTLVQSAIERTAELLRAYKEPEALEYWGEEAGTRHPTRPSRDLPRLKEFLWNAKETRPGGM